LTGSGRKLNSIAVIGNYLPRRCGIATFTTDLCNALAGQLTDGEVFALAMNDIPEGYDYPDTVHFEMRAAVPSDYLQAADYLNIKQTDAVILQHEFGIFGGTSGSYILRLARGLRMPLITTLHTVLSEPLDSQKAVIKELGRLSDRLVVMSHRAFDMLETIYEVPASKIVFIPHGIPDLPFVDPSFHKDQFGVEGRKLILTFGLLSPGKGIESMLQAMPEVVAAHPEAVYMVLGATHPNVKRESGEEYRQNLLRMTHKLGVDDHVLFADRFVTLEELCQYISAADIYVTPYRNKQQIVSGTLAYTLGAGKATVSTPYWYAEEMLGDGRGRLVPFDDSAALGKEVRNLLDDDVGRDAMRKRAYQFCRQMIWPAVAQSYIELLQGILDARTEKPKPIPTEAWPAQIAEELPEVDLRHLRTMTDDTGMFQHAVFATPERSHGYCSDDNARALIAVTLYYKLFQDESVLPLAHTYLAFLSDAYNPEEKRFKNFMAYDRKWLEKIGSDDSHARVIWALGVAVQDAPNDSILSLSVRLFSEALPSTEKMTSLRAWAFSLVGIHAYLARFGGDAAVRRIRARLARKLSRAFKKGTSGDWPWCEEVLTYANARVPQALLLSGQWLPDGKMVELGLSLLDWLIKIQTNHEGNFSFIGNQGWYPRGGTKARFDQQPIEAMTFIEACIEAYRVTRDRRWINESQRALDWFLGQNDLHTPLYNFKTGGCCDGLHPEGPNENQGAESTLAWLLSLLYMYQLRSETTLMDAKNST